MSGPSAGRGGDPADGRTRLLGTVGRGWRGAILVGNDLPLLIGVTFASLGMLDWLSGNLVSQATDPSPRSFVMPGPARTVVLAALRALLLAPLLVAIYRRRLRPTRRDRSRRPSCSCASPYGRSWTA